MFRFEYRSLHVLLVLAYISWPQSFPLLSLSALLSCILHVSFYLWVLIVNLLFNNNRLAEFTDLNVSDPVAHKHMPYVLILVKMADEWAKSHGGKLPSTREEKKEFKVYLLWFIHAVTYFCYAPLF